MGTGTGGLIDSRKGVIRDSVPLSIREALDSAKQVAAHVPVPCFIENDVNCYAWGEVAFNRS